MSSNIVTNDSAFDANVTPPPQVDFPVENFNASDYQPQQQTQQQQQIQPQTTQIQQQVDQSQQLTQSQSSQQETTETNTEDSLLDPAFNSFMDMASNIMPYNQQQFNPYYNQQYQQSYQQQQQSQSQHPQPAQQTQANNEVPNFNITPEEWEEMVTDPSLLFKRVYEDNNKIIQQQIAELKKDFDNQVQNQIMAMKAAEMELKVERETVRRLNENGINLNQDQIAFIKNNIGNKIEPAYQAYLNQFNHLRMQGKLDRNKIPYDTKYDAPWEIDEFIVNLAIKEAKDVFGKYGNTQQPLGGQVIRRSILPTKGGNTMPPQTNMAGLS